MNASVESSRRKRFGQSDSIVARAANRSVSSSPAIRIPIGHEDLPTAGGEGLVKKFPHTAQWQKA